MAEQRSDEIRRDIERTRAGMDRNVEALERRLTPGQVLDEVWNRVGRENSSAVSETIRRHPVPVALMGLGLGWLAVESTTGSREPRARYDTGRSGSYGSGSGTDAPAEGRVGPYRGDAVSHEEDGSGGAGAKAKQAAERAKEGGRSLADRAGGALDDAKERGEGAADGARDRARGLASGAGDQLDRARDGLEHSAERARDGLGHTAERARSGLRRMLEDYPLAVGAITFGLGMAAASSVPTTRREDELMGSTADSLKRDAKQTVRETTDSAKRVAKDAAGAAKEELDRQDIVEDLTDKAKQVAGAAEGTARESAEKEGLVTPSKDEKGERMVGDLENRVDQQTSRTQIPPKTDDERNRAATTGTGSSRSSGSSGSSSSSGSSGSSSSSSGGSSSRSSGSSDTGDPSTPLDERTVEQLQNRAAELDITGRSSMNKAELVSAIREKNG